MHPPLPQLPYKTPGGQQCQLELERPTLFPMNGEPIRVRFCMIIHSVESHLHKS